MGELRWQARVGVALLGTLGSVTTAFGADEACFDAYEQTQRLRKSGKLIEARDQALICARSSCPGLLRKDCVVWRDEIAKAIPTVVFAAKDDQGQDVTAVAVYVDDQKVSDSIDGRPVPLDTGPHRVRFESGDRKSESAVVVAPGDSGRRIEGRFAPPPVPAPLPEAVHAHRGIPTVSLVLGGVAAVGLVSFVSFAALGRVEQGCSPACQPGQISTLRAEYAVADVSWITGLAALGGAIVFWIVRPAAPPADAPPAKSATLRLQASPERRGATLGLQGSF